MGSNITFFIYSGNESTDSGHHSGTAKKCVKTDSNSSSPIGKISNLCLFVFETILTYLDKKNFWLSRKTFANLSLNAKNLENV